MEIYVGTSGWMYDWNEGASFDWYIKYSGLNAIELNASFYRFPFRNQVLGWSRKTKIKNIRWSIKVHRSITHFRKLSDKSIDIWNKFKNLFEPLDQFIDFYLFQMPPSFSKTDENIKRVEYFYEKTGLGERFAIEFRHKSWFNESTIKWAEKLGFTIVSIDAPIATWIVKSNRNVYLRLHGKEYWYAHEYSEEELKELAEESIRLKPDKIYVFFNNNHWMLENARKMYNILLQYAKKIEK